MYVERDSRTGKFVVRMHRGKGGRDLFTWATRRDAKARMEKLIEQRGRSALGIHKQMTLSDASVIFHEHILPKLANDLMRQHCQTYWKQINESLGSMFLDEITYQTIVSYWESFLKRGCKPSTANRSIMWIENLYNRFRSWNAMVPTMMPEKVALPEDNPVKTAKEFLGRRRSELPFRRKRMLSRQERQAMKAWCMDHDPEFWNDIKMAMLTSLRKSDLLALEQGAKIEGIQGKTQRPFELPITLDHQVRGGRAMRTRWDNLRKDLGWNVKGTPLHTTWHDLRHCGPSMMADMNVGSRVLQSVLGHSRPEMSERYTHASSAAMRPALAALKKELDSI